jgi:uncharacterized NAD(P)/FAD-binding protein YdhS
MDRVEVSNAEPMLKRSSPFEVAIIGGGFAGSILAAYLLRSGAVGDMRVRLIERDTRLGGVAHGTEVPHQLLNEPIRKMSAFTHDPGHFLRWMRPRKELLSNEGLSIDGVELAEVFVPRKVYGAYIRDTLDEAAKNASESVYLERIHGEAVAINRDADGAVVCLGDGRSFFAHRIVLTIGNYPADPPPPPVDDPSFYGSPRYVGYPWSPGVLDGIFSDAPVMLIGTGLTMVDQALTLRARGHRGKIHAVSRRGLLPHVHGPTVSYPVPLEPGKAPKTVLGLFRRVREEVRAAATRGIDWRSVVDALRPVNQDLWQALPPEEKRRFIRHLRPYWEVHRHRLPPEVAGTIGEMLEAGQLVVHAGRIRSYVESSRGVEVKIERNAQIETLPAVRVINCSGPVRDYRRVRHLLIANLMEQGWASPGPLGMGLDVDGNGALRGKDGALPPVLYAIGILRKGYLYETTAVRDIRVQAAELARLLIEDVCP